MYRSIFYEQYTETELMSELEIINESFEREYQEKAEKECMKILFDTDTPTEKPIPEFPSKNKNRGVRRKKTEHKAKRKEKILMTKYRKKPTKPHGYYRKGKIHSSNAMCSGKTNGSINKSKGAISPIRHFARLALTHKRYGRKNYKPSDIKKVDSLITQLNDFYTE